MSKPNPLPAPAFDDPKHHLRIYHGDCLDLLALIPESSVDLVFADPPSRRGKRRLNKSSPTAASPATLFLFDHACLA